MSAELQALAARAGVLTEWIDYQGIARQVPLDTLVRVLDALGLPCSDAAKARASLAQLEAEDAALPPLVTATAGEPVRLPAGALAGAAHVLLENGSAIGLSPAGEPGTFTPITVPGYHRLEIGAGLVTLAVAPRRAFGVGDAAPGRRVWGLGAQMYSLRGASDGGPADFGALARVARAAARHGADAIATSPVHALFAAEPDRFSPYSPSSRLFLNVLHADPAVIGERWAGTAQAADSELLDWPASARARLGALRDLYGRVRDREDVRSPLEAFRARGGDALRDHACFEALHAQIGHARWQEWSGELRNPRGPGVADFERGHAAEVGFHAFLQWLAARSLAAAQHAARDAGMAIGVIGDLAVGTDAGGSHAWSRQDQLLSGLGVGAPPDLINPLGQEWGLTAFSPRALRSHGYAAFIELLRAALEYVGGLRIDHVMGLLRLWLVPRGARPTEGAYLRYPVDDLLRLIALESWRRRAVIVGEDLGTVPGGFREQLAGAGLMGLRLLWFEKDHGLFVHPSRWDAHAVATTSTHDLPTVAGWWRGRDLDWRARLGQLPPDSDEARERALRDEHKRALWAAFEHSGVASGPAPEEPAPVLDAAVRFVAMTPSPLAIVPVEDVVGIEEQANLPGTIDEHPNWRRRLPAPVEELLERPEVAARLAAVNGLRR